MRARDNDRLLRISRGDDGRSSNASSRERGAAPLLRLLRSVKKAFMLVPKPQETADEAGLDRRMLLEHQRQLRELHDVHVAAMPEKIQNSFPPPRVHLHSGGYDWSTGWSSGRDEF